MIGETISLAQLPPGSRQLPRQGRALSGAELAEGLVGLVERELGVEAAAEAEERLARCEWAAEHLTWPRAQVEWWTDGRGLWMRVELGRGLAWEFGWEDRDADVRQMRRVGPCERPDDLREALGLPIVVKFEDRAGNYLNVRVSEPAVEPTILIDDKVVEPVRGADPVVVTLEVPASELVAEVPQAPQLVTQSSKPAPAKPAGAQLLKGGRK